jgi:hypothetical protein
MTPQFESWTPCCHLFWINLAGSVAAFLIDTWEAGLGE